MLKFTSLLAGLLLSALGQSQPLFPLPEHPDGLSWPTESWPSGAIGEDVDRALLDQAIAELFAVKHENGVPETRAVLIIQGGKIVLEQYAEGFDKNSRFHSWSAAKSFTNALIGVLAKQGKLELDQPAAIPAWKDDARNQNSYGRPDLCCG
jgi:CubicO group peptidase (beta-lactamase class C family)